MADFTPQLGRGGKFDRAMYYRRPDKGEDKRWIVIGSRTHLEQMMERGFEPLRAVGYISAPDPEEWFTEHGFDWSPWATILMQKGGPDLFPADQVLAYRWYRAEDCPVPGVQWKQLSGNKITHYKCPECPERPPFPAVDGVGGIDALARHLKLHHSWDRISLVKYGEKVGIDFDAIYSNVTESFEFEVGKEVEGCDECDYVPPGDSKNPKAALRMHKMGAHKPLEVAEVG